LNRRGVHNISASTKYDVSVSLPRASIASGGNLPVLHWDHWGAVLPGKRARGVTGSIIHHNDLIRLGKRFQSAANGGNTSANPSFFVVCWNDERNHLPTFLSVVDWHTITASDKANLQASRNIRAA
jgi:hypothetical protein